MIKYFLISICTILYTTGFIYAQQDSLSTSVDSTKSSTIWKNLKYDASNVVGGFLHTFSQPTRWQKDDYYKLAGTIAGVSLLYLVDEEADDFFQGHKEDIPIVVRDFGWYFGSPQNNYGITGGVYLFGLFTNNEKMRQAGVLMITSASAAGLIQQTTKTLIGRARPNAGLGKSYFKPFGGEAAYRSFPSGHTVLSVTTMYALSKQFSNPWIKTGFYIVGIISPVSRLWDGAHWLTDVALSTVLSIAIVEGIDSYLKQQNKYSYDKEFSQVYENQKDKINWSLKIGAYRLGLVGSF
ncbi:phosphatase PAP2 family protein [Gelidibacter japonicus]|uniref:phosphatase PAP2 family protein n=1 Tax=Gelidibacter japonicus TaxID=1962232 RepID=UPI0013D5F569|nr:phosphatase PAP2 family protein [Gelidibacter japonicus]